jgi:inorganic triphosphatase YgiF
MSEHLEIEQKFDVDDGFLRPGGRALEEALRGERGERISAGEPVLHRLSATYFDTADGRLMSRKITLRRRTGGTDAGWHLKLPGGGSAGAGGGTADASGGDGGSGASTRREVRAPLGTAEGQVPEDLAARVAEVTGGLPLAPVATLDTERTVVILRGHGGRVVAEIADDVVTAQRLTGPGQDGGAGAPGRWLRWREIEVEVPVAAPGLQRAAADLLLAAGARPAGHGSKLARVLRG